MLDIKETPWGKFYIGSDEVSEKLNRGEFHDDFLLPIYDQYVNKDSIVIDGGAHIGSQTVYLAARAKEVHAFEPQLFVYNHLLQNIKLNNLTNVRAYNNALYSESDVCFKLEKKFDYSITGSAGLGLIKDESGGIKSIAIDDLDLEKLDFCKIDCQGAEMSILNGAVLTIKRCKPIIVLEIESPFLLLRYNSQATQILEFFYEMGYNYSNLTSADYLAIPK